LAFVLFGTSDRQSYPPERVTGDEKPMKLLIVFVMGAAFAKERMLMKA